VLQKSFSTLQSATILAMIEQSSSDIKGDLTAADILKPPDG
jgi:hypothetical protein